jgi:hypothetical protein
LRVVIVALAVVLLSAALHEWLALVDRQKESNEAKWGN